MKVLIVSDTHGKDENLEAAVYKEAPFDLLIHCGDVEGREIFTEALVDCPCCMVSGNNDFFTDLPREEQIEFCGKRILVTHGHYYGVSMGHEEIVEKTKAKAHSTSFKKFSSFSLQLAPTDQKFPQR